MPVGSDGLIDLKELEDSITDKTLLVSIMGVHKFRNYSTTRTNWTIRNNNVFFIQTAQAIGKIPLDVGKMNIENILRSQYTHQRVVLFILEERQ